MASTTCRPGGCASCWCAVSGSVGMGPRRQASLAHARPPRACLTSSSLRLPLAEQGFQTFLTMLGSSVLIPSLLVPAMGGDSSGARIWAAVAASLPCTQLLVPLQRLTAPTLFLTTCRSGGGHLHLLLRGRHQHAAADHPGRPAAHRSGRLVRVSCRRAWARALLPAHSCPLASLTPFLPPCCPCSSPRDPQIHQRRVCGDRPDSGLHDV